MELDAIPPTRDTAPEMPVRRPEPPLSAQVGGNGAAEKSSPKEGSSDVPTAAMSLLVISQKKNISPSGEPSPRVGAVAPVDAAKPAAPVAVAPEAPKSSAPSSSGAVGGRRGRNISNAGTGTSAGASSDGPDASAPVVNPSAPAGPKPSSISTAPAGGASAKRNPSPNSNPRIGSAAMKGGASVISAKPPPAKPTVP